jgi:cytochrome c peroxidase
MQLAIFARERGKGSGASRSRVASWLLRLIVGVGLGAGLTGAQADEQKSIQGRYVVSLIPQTRPVPVNEWHQWAIHIERRDGAPLALREVALDGGMPAHGHGLPTAPNVSGSLSAGEFMVRGVRFNMAGHWKLRVLIADEAGTDAAVFPVSVEFGAAAPAASQEVPDPTWSDSERAMLHSLWIGSLGPVPPDPSNRVADDPRAAALGHKLFFDPGLSGNGQIACASCHQPGKLFTDGRAKGHGLDDLDRKTPSLVGIGYSRWFYWDGRRDSAWSQALSPIEAPPEMNGTRVQALRLIASRLDYRSEYQSLFGPLPDLDGLPERAGPSGEADAQAAWSVLPPARQEALTRAFVNIGKAIAAYERKLLPGASAFDRYVEAIERGDLSTADHLLSPRAVRGLKLFLSGNTQCLKCHNGPLLTNGGFHNIGTGSLDGEHPDFGRSIGIQALFATEFNCFGPYNDDSERACPELRFLNRHDESSVLVGAYKVPSLRNVALTAPYMHDGRFATLAQVINHYRNPGPSSAMIEFRPFFDMTPQHVEALVAFLETLSGSVDAPRDFLRPPGYTVQARTPSPSVERQQAP